MTSVIDPTPVAATFSKDPKFWGKDFRPDRLSRGKGAYVTSSGGQQYLDWVSGLGAVLLGHGHPEFTRRILKQAREGVAFSLPHTLEREVADKLVNLLGTRVLGWSPENLQVRFGLSGTDATTTAVRLARAVTSRDRVLSSGYHGWGDWSIGKTPPAYGVPKAAAVLTADFAFGACSTTGDYWPATSVEIQGQLSLEEAFAAGPPVAAVILEVPLHDPPIGWLDHVGRLCTEHGAIFILDEVVTGLRYGLGGAAGMFLAQPDLVCMSKALGNGVPISAVIGHRDLLHWFGRNDPVFVSGTGFGNTLSLAAANAVLDIWDQAKVRHLWKIGDALVTGLRQSGYDILGKGPRSLIQFRSPSERAFFIVGMRDRGILWNRPTLPNLAHTLADVQRTVQAAQEIKIEMARVDVEALMADRLPVVLFENR